MNGRIIVHEKSDVRIIDLPTHPVIVGRDPESDIRILDQAVSMQHCRIEPCRSGFRLVDLGSPDGTVVNGRRVVKKTLRSGDRVTVGEALLYYQVPPADKVDDHRPAQRKRRSGSTSRYGAEPRVKIDRVLSRVFDEQGLDELLELRGYVENFVEERSSAISGRGTTRENLSRLQEITRAITSELNLGKLLNLIVDSVIQLTKAERGFLLLRSGRKLEIRTARNLDGEPIRKPGTKISRSIAEEVAKSGQPMITINAQTDERLTSSGSVSDLKLRSVMAVALKLKGKVTGVLYVDNRFEEGVFTKVDLPLVEAFADQTAIAVENARLVLENQRRQAELMQAKEKVEELNRVLNEKVRRQSAELTEVRQILRKRQDELEFRYSYDNIIGESSRMREVFLLLDKVTDSDIPVLIYGDSGTGKELVARAIHFNGPRKNGPFVSENCSAIPDTLLESELFGYAKGAFTGADRDKRGLIAAAEGGTLLLDEIADMSIEMQAKLLRVLEEREVRPLGGKEPEPVDVHILAATNQDLRRLMGEGRFREDLFYRLAVITVRLPPLKERQEDIPLLVAHFIHDYARDRGEPEKEVTEEAMAVLTGFDWPGNVRQLRNEIQRAVALADRVIVPEILSEEIRLGSVPFVHPDRLENRPLKEIAKEVVQAVERQIVQDVLAQEGWKKTAAARRLGISRPTLDSKISLYGLTRGAHGGVRPRDESGQQEH